MRHGGEVWGKIELKAAFPCTGCSAPLHQRSSRILDGWWRNPGRFSNNKILENNNRKPSSSIQDPFLAKTNIDVTAPFSQVSRGFDPLLVEFSIHHSPVKGYPISTYQREEPAAEFSVFWLIRHACRAYQIIEQNMLPCWYSIYGLC